MENGAAKRNDLKDGLARFRSGVRILRDERAEKSSIKFIQEDGDFKRGEEYFSFQVKCGYLPERNTFQVVADICLPKCREIEMYGELVDAETFEVLEKLESIRNEGITHLSYNVTEKLHLSDGKTIEDVLVVMNAGWIEEGKISEEWAAALESFTKSPFVKDAIVYHPQKQNGVPYVCKNADKKLQEVSEGDYLFGKWMKDTEMLRGGKDTINIALFRTPADCKDLDYLCKLGKNEKGQPYFAVPTQGSVSADSTTLRIKEVEARCYLTDRQNQNGFYMVADSNGDQMTQNIKVYFDGVSVKWEHMGKWDSAFLYSGNWKEYIFDYLLRVRIMWTFPGSEELYTSFFNVTSLDKMQFDEGSYLKILPISIMWGCLGADTLIALADGSQRKIKDIRIGNMVKTENGVAEVGNVWRGTEEQYLLVCSERSSLVLTPEHPVLTKTGWKRAVSLSKDDEIRTADGGYALITSIEKKDAQLEVYNLSYREKTENTILAEGFVVGNFEAQNNPDIYTD